MTIRRRVLVILLAVSIWGVLVSFQLFHPSPMKLVQKTKGTGVGRMKLVEQFNTSETITLSSSHVVKTNNTRLNRSVQKLETSDRGSGNSTNNSAGALMCNWQDHSTNSRHRDVAVCMSGSLRAALQPLNKLINKTLWPDALSVLLSTPKDKTAGFYKLLNEKDGLNAHDTVRLFLYPSLGKFDVFMYVPVVHADSFGAVDAKEACNAFTPLDVSNRLFCASWPETPVSHTDIGVTEEDFAGLEGRFRPKGTWEGFLQQIKGYTNCNALIRLVEAEEGSSYRWIVRLRPDSIFFCEFPHVGTIPLENDTIYIRPRNYCCGNEDMFNIGSASLMHMFMDRFYDIGGPKLNMYKKVPATAELYAIRLLNLSYGGKFAELPGLVTTPYRFRRFVEFQSSSAAYRSKPSPPNMAWCTRRVG